VLIVGGSCQPTWLHSQPRKGNTVLSLEDKLNILKRLDKGETQAKLALEYGK
jgi:hypothetical protein